MQCRHGLNCQNAVSPPAPALTPAQEDRRAFIPFTCEDLSSSSACCSAANKQAPQAFSHIGEMLHVGCVERLLAPGWLADCSCPWAGHCSLYQYCDISSASKDIQREGGAARSCCAQASPAACKATRRQSSRDLKPCRGCFCSWGTEMRDQRMSQQLVTGNSILWSECWGAWGSGDRPKWLRGL